MVYITASKCGHTIDHASSPIGHTTIASLTISLCASCRDFQKLHQYRQVFQTRLERATKNAKEPSGEVRMTEKLRKDRINLSKITAALHNDADYREQHDERTLAPRDSKGQLAMETRWFTTPQITGASMFEWPKATSRDIEMSGTINPTIKHVRFEEGEYSPEADYRPSQQFRRVGNHSESQSDGYYPGRYAPSDDGFINTSDPEAEVNAMFAQMRKEATQKAANEVEGKQGELLQRERRLR